MLTKQELIDAITAGNADALCGTAELVNELASDGDVVIATRRVAERVAWHRNKYHDTVARAVELGVECDIWTAARAGLAEKVKQLLSVAPERLNATDKFGRTPLQRSALVYGDCKECEDVVDFLIEQGATIDVFTASTFGMLDVVEREIERDASLATARCQGSTALNWAVRPRRNYDAAPTICKTLIGAGASLNDADQDESGMTPLHHAAEWGPKVCLQLVDLLLKAGAELNCQDEQGWTPLDYATDRNRTEMVEHLVAAGAISKK